MKPKEKAKVLVDKFIFIDDGSKFQIITIEDEKKAINCALIAVDELLNNFLSNRTTKYGRERYHFWQEVKQEIKKL